MDKDKLEQEFNEVLTKLSGCTAGSEEYRRLLNDLQDLYSIIDRDNISELKMLEYRRQLEKDDYDAQIENARLKSRERSDKAVKWIEVLRELLKSGSGIAGTILGIIIIGELDKMKVLPGKLLSLATRMLPKI